jgi:glutaredoxin
LDAQVLGVSIDHVPCLQAWAESLGGINYPLMSDFWPHGKIASLYGVFREKEGDSERAIFVIDKRGIIRYIDIHDIDHQPDNDVVLEVLRRVDPEAALRSPALPPLKPEEIRLPHGGIVMYCTRWCPGCRRARAWFQTNKIDYIEVDIDVTPGAAEQLKLWAKGTRTTPTFDIEGTILVGYDEKKVEQAIHEKIKK